MIVIFTAPCPECGADATWQQATGSGYTVSTTDLTITCRPCATRTTKKAA